LNLKLAALLREELRNVEGNVTEAGLVVFQRALAMIRIADELVFVVFSQHDVEQVVTWVLSNDILCQRVPTSPKPSQVVIVLDGTLMLEVTIKFKFEHVWQGDWVETLEHVGRAILSSLITHGFELGDMFPKPVKTVDGDGLIIMPVSKRITLEVMSADTEAVLGIPPRHPFAFFGWEVIKSGTEHEISCLGECLGFSGQNRLQRLLYRWRVRHG
jgi:hypothetical protein